MNNPWLPTRGLREQRTRDKQAQMCGCIRVHLSPSCPPRGPRAVVMRTLSVPILVSKYHSPNKRNWGSLNSRAGQDKHKLRLEYLMMSET